MWQSPLPTCSRCPRNARLTIAAFRFKLHLLFLATQVCTIYGCLMSMLNKTQFNSIMASDITIFMIRSKYFHQKVASVLIPYSWTRSMRCPAFHRPNVMLASRCAWVFSSDMIFTPKFLGLLVHTFCISDGSPNNQQLWRHGFFVVGEKQNHCCSISIAPECAWCWSPSRENAPLSILAADSKRSFWAAWTVMQMSRSQFAWQYAQMKQSSIRRVVERQVELLNYRYTWCWFRRYIFRRYFDFRLCYRRCNVNGIAIDISWIALGSFVIACCGRYEKAVDFSRGGHRLA